MRRPTAKEYVHERLGERFRTALSDYDTQRRLEVLVDGFLNGKLSGRTVLEIGAGLGFFSERLQKRGAIVTATDIGERMLQQIRETVGCHCECVDALSLSEHFGSNRFDIVLSSECIEHTPDPMEALRQMVAVLKPGGYIALSTPNYLWYPVVRAATLLKLRPFDGFENFSSFHLIRRTLQAVRVRILRESGLHLFPFQLPFHSISRWCDDHLQLARKLMINICVLGQKA
jgi:2-polyprenyl-3-methyl-5-hydroxy-6-metoxy-1,4-benzoquinol methylase